MNELLFLFIACVPLLLSVFATIYFNKQKRKIRDTLNKLLELVDSIEDFKFTHFLIKFPLDRPVSIPEPIGLAIDDQSKKICLINGKNLRIIDYFDVIESEVISGGETVTKTSRASQFVGATVGGVILGGAGAVIGGLSGKTVTKQVIKNVWLKLLINDTHNPVHKIDFIETSYITRNGQETNPIVALKEAQEWHDLISVIIRRAEKEYEYKSDKNLVPVADKISFIEQLSQLSEPHKTGLLTDDEFFKAKNKLLDIQ